MERFAFSATASESGRKLSGIAHAFGARTLRGNRYIEFAKGAFDKVLQTSDVRAFWNHDSTLLLGRQSNGTVRITANDDGLGYEIDVPDTSYGNDLLELVRRGDLNEMSFGITPGRSIQTKTESGKPLTVYQDVESLFDISPVSIPAFSGTQVSLHSAEEVESLGSQLVRARHKALTGEK